MPISIGRPYGVHLLGDNNIVFVAPHGGDAHEAALSHSLLELSRDGAGVIINDRVRREEIDLNSRAQIQARGHVAASAFWEDIVAAVERAARVADGECYVFFVHNTPDKFVGATNTFPRVIDGEIAQFNGGESRPYQLDIGAGVTWVKPKCRELNTGDVIEAIEYANDRSQESALNSWIRPASEVWPERGKRGLATFPRDQLLLMVYLANELNLPWVVEIGREFAAQRMTNLTQSVFRQFRKTGRVYTAQLEFVSAVPIGEVLRYLLRVTEFCSNFGLEQKTEFGE